MYDFLGSFEKEYYDRIVDLITCTTVCSKRELSYIIGHLRLHLIVTRKKKNKQKQKTKYEFDF